MPKAVVCPAFPSGIPMFQNLPDITDTGTSLVQNSYRTPQVSFRATAAARIFPILSLLLHLQNFTRDADRHLYCSILFCCAFLLCFLFCGLLWLRKSPLSPVFIYRTTKGYGKRNNIISPETPTGVFSPAPIVVQQPKIRKRTKSQQKTR